MEKEYDIQKKVKAEEVRKEKLEAKQKKIEEVRESSNADHSSGSGADHSLIASVTATDNDICSNT